MRAEREFTDAVPAGSERRFEQSGIERAHVLGHGAPGIINIFALALASGLTGADLRAIPWTYPTVTSDPKHMLKDPQS